MGDGVVEDQVAAWLEGCVVALLQHRAEVGLAAEAISGDQRTLAVGKNKAALGIDRAKV